MHQGYLALVLHAHLPYVRHPERDKALEERWFYEALTETYIPLVKIFDGLIRDGVDFRITLSMSPPLLSMLKDKLLMERYGAFLDKTRDLAAKEVDRTSNDPNFNTLAKMYYRLFDETDDILNHRYGGNLLQAFNKYLARGNVELITSAATHGYLPLLSIRPESVRAQIKNAVDTFVRLFHQLPRGIWLPECGYSPGVDKILKEHGIDYFFVDTHGLLFAKPRPRYAVYAPVICPGSGVAAFGRDVESSIQVWSAQEGYPGDPDYREFYRDIGYDLDWEYIKDYVFPNLRIDTGLKYYRITGKTEWKEPYMPEWAHQKAAIHAGNFMFNREKQIEHLAGLMDRPPIVVAPYDAELFGHWWFEGPVWLDFLLRKIAFDQQTFRTITPGEYLNRFTHNQPATPCMSSWGNRGYNDVWLEGSNDWIYRHLHQAAKRMSRMASTPAPSLEQTRLLRQAARELMLAESSDWAFIMKTGTMVDYAKERTISHLGRFLQLYEGFTQNSFDDRVLAEFEKKDNIFPLASYSAYQS